MTEPTAPLVESEPGNAVESAGKDVDAQPATITRLAINHLRAAISLAPDPTGSTRIRPFDATSPPRGSPADHQISYANAHLIRCPRSGTSRSGAPGLDSHRECLSAGSMALAGTGETVSSWAIQDGRRVGQVTVCVGVVVEV